MSFPDLFRATLNMFSLDPQTTGSLSAKHIKSVFEQVLKAEELCHEELKKIPSKHEDAGFKTT
jgi:hypothetical protein